MKENNRFNTDYMGDLPASIIKELKGGMKPRGFGERSLQLLELFKLKKTLTMEEIIVGMFRTYQVEVKRVWVTSALYRLKAKELIKKVKGKKSTYELLKKEGK